MAGGDSYRMNGDGICSSDDGGGGRRRGEGKIHISHGVAFVLILLSVLLSVVVGLIVHLAGGGTTHVQCMCGEEGNSGGVTDAIVGGTSTSTPTPTPTPTPVVNLTETCMRWIMDGNTAVCAYCPSTSASTAPPVVSTTPAPSGERLNYRLPATVKPYHYNVALQPHIYGDNSSQFFFNGSASIWIECTVSTSNITLHTDGLDVDNSSNAITVTSLTTSQIIPVTRTTYEEKRHFYDLHLGMPLTQGHHYRIDFEYFKGPLPTDGSGLYLSSYLDGNKTVYLATTQMEAPYARQAFPCFDEPHLKATFNISLYYRNHTGRNYMALSNTDVTATYPAYEDWVYSEFLITPVMPTYLLAFIVCDYKVWENTTSNNVTYRTLARPNYVEFAEIAHNDGVKLYEKLESHFDPDYPISKLDNIAIPDFNAGAMENWGLITYRETLLYEAGVSTASDRDWIAEVVAHELAHMWFGNLVSPMWWDWLWLNEAFASFWDFYTVHEVYPHWRTIELFICQDMHGVFVSDSLKTSHPMTADVMTPSEISSIFDSVTYTKGAAIVRMMYTLMGKENFIEGLNIYLNRMKYGSAVHQDLWDALTEGANAWGRSFNVTSLMDSWVTQMNYPVITVIRTADHTVNVTQSRFLRGEPDANDVGKYGYMWDIPVSFTSSSDLNFNRSYQYEEVPLWLNHNTRSALYNNATLIPVLNDPNSWIIANVRQHGYYRVNYDEANWNALIQQLDTNHMVIDNINRAQIINDAWNLVKAERLSMSIALRTIGYLRQGKELDYVPWMAFNREISYVETMLERTPIFHHLQAFIRNAVSEPLAILGSNITEEMIPMDVFTRTLLVYFACTYEDANCTQTARQALQDWRDRNTRVNANLQRTFFCTAIRDGDTGDWLWLYGQYKQETVASPQARLLYALSCTKEPYLLERVLEMAMNESEVRLQDRRTAITNVGGSRYGRDIAWTFLNREFARLKQGLSTSSMSRLLSSLTEHFNTRDHLRQINTLRSSNDVSGLESAFDSVTEQTNSNIEWMENNYGVIADWLATLNGN